MIRSLLNLWSRRRWRWIGTAPLDVWILLVSDEGDLLVGRGRQGPAGVCFDDWRGFEIQRRDACYWMPLPRLPERTVPS